MVLWNSDFYFKYSHSKMCKSPLHVIGQCIETVYLEYIKPIQAFHYHAAVCAHYRILHFCAFNQSDRVKLLTAQKVTTSLKPISMMSFHLLLFLTARVPLVRSSPSSRPRELSPHHGGSSGWRGDLRRSSLCSPDSQRWCFLPLSAPAHRLGCRILPAREAVLWKPRHHPLVGTQSMFSIFTHVHFFLYLKMRWD